MFESSSDDRILVCFTIPERKSDDRTQPHFLSTDHIEGESFLLPHMFDLQCLLSKFLTLPTSEVSS